MIGPLGRLGAAATLRQHCPQMTQRRCKWISELRFVIEYGVHAMFTYVAVCVRPIWYFCALEISICAIVLVWRGPAPDWRPQWQAQPQM